MLRSRQDQIPGTLGFDAKSVNRTGRDMGKTTLRCTDRLSAVKGNTDLSFKNIERLVVPIVFVQRNCITFPANFIDEAEFPAS